MGTFTARSEREKVRREKLASFFYDSAKLSFGGMVIGGIINIQFDDYKHTIGSIAMVVAGFTTTAILATIANKILK